LLCLFVLCLDALYLNNVKMNTHLKGKLTCGWICDCDCKIGGSCAV